jgi:antitoxin (DNA-binding transcriptional repressor) of toxin-antitoxin stability system
MRRSKDLISLLQRGSMHRVPTQVYQSIGAPRGNTPVQMTCSVRRAVGQVDEVTSGGYHDPMKAVGIKTLKAKLSEYVRLAKSGETILVTEREDVVAELRPAHRQPQPAGSLEDALETLADRQEIILRSAEGRWTGPRTVTRLAGFSSQALLDELRRDGE